MSRIRRGDVAVGETFISDGNFTLVVLKTTKKLIGYMTYRFDEKYFYVGTISYTSFYKSVDYWNIRKLGA